MIFDSCFQDEEVSLSADIWFIGLLNNLQNVDSASEGFGSLVVSDY
jgi:hypothetical protein